MGDTDYWKKRYQQAWEKSSRRESAIITRIAQEAGPEVVPVGLGAGSQQYLAGSARSHGQEKGGADLQVTGRNIFLEVTGPQSQAVQLKDPLWLRPDKVENARCHLAEHETWAALSARLKQS